MSDATNPLLAALGGQGGPPVDPSQQNQPAPEVQNAPPPQETMTQNQPITAPPTAKQQLKSVTTPGLPAIVSLIGQMIHPQGQVQSGQLPRPPSRLDEFEKFLGNFSVSLAQGMAQSGHGPGANIRGAGAAMMAPREQGIQNVQLQQQAAAQQAQTQETQARAALTQAQAEQAKNVVMTPYGPMQAGLAEKIFGAQIAAGGKTAAAQIAAQASVTNKRFITVPNMGVFDTQANGGKGAMVPGGSNAITVTPEIQKQYGLPDQLLGKPVSVSQLAVMERAQNTGLSTVTGAEGPAVVNKAAALKGSPGAVRSLGLGSAATNPTAQVRLTKETVGKEFDEYQDSLSRYNIMQKNFEDATKTNDQQAMLSLLANHLGMTMGLAKGARINQAIISEAEQSRPWLQGMGSKFDKDGYLTGVTLTPPQMSQMINLAKERLGQDQRKLAATQAFYQQGGGSKVPKGTPAADPVTNLVNKYK
jgi:hypothetical protein